MKTEKTVYCVQVQKSYGTEWQYLKPSEFNLIKTMLNDGIVILRVCKELISLNRYKSIFGQ